MNYYLKFKNLIEYYAVIIMMLQSIKTEILMIKRQMKIQDSNLYLYY